MFYSKALKDGPPSFFPDKSWCPCNADHTDGLHTHGSDRAGLIAVGETADLEGQALVDHEGKAVEGPF